MRIEAHIDYWVKEVLTFDPIKVLERLEDYLPEVDVDNTDYKLEELERFTIYANENIEEPQRSIMINQMRENNWANGPWFKFKVSLEHHKEITGKVSRYSVDFCSEEIISFETEKNIINFLKSLKYGEIRSDTQTKYFCKSDENYKDHWLLEESI